MRFLGFFLVCLLPALGFGHGLEDHSLLQRAAARAAPTALQENGPFTLADISGTKVTNASLKNGYHLVFFGFTSCPDECPQAMSLIASAYGKLPAEIQQKLQVVMVSVDPARDTPQVLANYVHGFNPAFTGWRGPKPQVDQITRNFLTYYGIKDGEVSHTAFIFLTGPDGHIIKHFGASTAKADDMAATLRNTIK